MREFSAFRKLISLLESIIFFSSASSLESASFSVCNRSSSSSSCVRSRSNNLRTSSCNLESNSSPAARFSVVEIDSRSV
uniref:Putative secreted protein n=1 Tax=Anopheles triannulatus TaxID=58253 RepID=A0A2M4B1E6_9DIPT